MKRKRNERKCFPRPLSIEELRWSAPPPSGHVAPLETIVGQERGIAALEFGLDLDIGVNPNANIFVTGPNGTGRATIVQRKLEELAVQAGTQADRVFSWVYVHNFQDPSRPVAIRFRNSELSVFRMRLDAAREQTKEAVRNFQRIFNEAVGKFASERQLEFEEKLKRINASSSDGVKITVQQNPMTGQVHMIAVYTAPGHGQQPLPPERLTDEHRKMQKQAADAFDKMMQVIEEKKEDVRRDILEHRVKAPVAALLEEAHTRDTSKEDRPAQERIVSYFEGLLDYLDKNLKKFLTYEEFLAQTNQQGISPHALGAPENPYLPFEVNVFFEPRDHTRVPVVIEENPKYGNLFGKVETRFEMGRYVTNHTMIRRGSLHEANGGFIIIDALALLQDPLAWDALKRTIKTRRLQISNRMEELDIFRIDGGLRPEPIPFRAKVVLLGALWLYYALTAHDPDFSELFEIHAPFDSTMKLDERAVEAYHSFVAMVREKKHLLPFSPEAISRIVEEGVREAGSRKKISAQFGHVQRLMTEANVMAQRRNADTVEKQDVLAALKAQEHRASLLADKYIEGVLDRVLLIETEGEAVGQVNGLVVWSLPDGYHFGLPSRVTAQTSVGRAGVVSVEKESKLAGKMLEKSISTIQGYLEGTYAQTMPLALTARVAFEEAYEGVDGPSASLAEVIAILSSLSGVPVKQGWAITGSMDQMGNAQSIGGVNEKIEGMFRVCNERGLTGEQGVVIPQSNVQHLQLKEEVVEAVRNGRFHVVAVRTIDEALEAMTGVPAKIIHKKARKKLASFLEVPKKQRNTEKKHEMTEEQNP